MEHKLLVAQSLRNGLAEIKAIYKQAFYATSAFSEQWQYFIVKEAYGIDWHEHRKIQDDFAWKSRRILSKIGAR